LKESAHEQHSLSHLQNTIHGYISCCENYSPLRKQNRKSQQKHNASLAIQAYINYGNGIFEIAESDCLSPK
jgi:hypothetical protein